MQTLFIAIALSLTYIMFKLINCINNTNHVMIHSLIMICVFVLHIIINSHMDTDIDQTPNYNVNDVRNTNINDIVNIHINIMTMLCAASGESCKG